MRRKISNRQETRSDGYDCHILSFSDIASFLEEFDSGSGSGSEMDDEEAGEDGMEAEGEREKGPAV